MGMKVTTSTGRKITIDPDCVVSIVTDNFSKLSKIKIEDKFGIHQTHTIKETALEFMERLNNA